jgi:RNA polymerase sigma factor (sigma-70 family)
MSADGLRAVFHRLRQLTDPGSTGLSDAELLDRYTRTADQAAFELLLWRHGPMVHGVCRRILRRTEDAEDAFQATFLTLVRKAGSVRRGVALGAWLYQVAYRVALRSRASVVPREEPASEPAAASTADDLAWRELSPVLDEEVRRLPARYRDPVVLCYLEGRTHAEAARELGCPKGTVAIRLLRARKLLQKRLTRRGVTLAGGVLIAVAATPASAALVAHTLRTAFGGPVPVRVTALTEGVIRAMSLTRLKVVSAALALAVGLLAGGSAVLSRAEPPGRRPAQPVVDESAKPASAPSAEPAPAVAAEKKDGVLARVPALRDGQILVIGTEIAPGEKVASDHRVVVTVGTLLVGPSKIWQPWKEGDGTWKPWKEGDDITAKSLKLQREKKEYKRLEVGDEIKAGRTVALVDPLLAIGDFEIKLASLDAAEADKRAARKTKEEAERRVAAQEESMRRVPGSVSKDDYEGAKLTARRYYEEEIAKNSAVIKAQQELIRAQTILSMYEVHTPVSGVIKSIERQSGEAVRALETILVVGATRTARPARAVKKERMVGGSRDGVLVLSGTDIKPGEVVFPEDEVILKSGGLAKRYSRLCVGDTVETGQLLGRLDDRLARVEIRLAEAQLEARKADLSAAVKSKEEAERRLKAKEESMRQVPGSVSKDDYEGAKLTARRNMEEEIAARAGVAVMTAKLEQLNLQLQTYEIRSPIRGVVRELMKVPGEAVHVGEPIFRIAATPAP